MQIASRPIAAEPRFKAGQVSAALRRRKHVAGSRPIIDFLDDTTVIEIEDSVRKAMGSGCAFDLSVDDDAWPVSGCETQLKDALVDIARDASAAMQGEGVLHMCVLNVFDRCGGDHDQVLLAISHAGDADHGRAGSAHAPAVRRSISAPGVARAMKLAADSQAEFDLIGGPGEGTSISLLFPRFQG